MTNPRIAGVLVAILMGGLTGCTTIYQAATDERPLSVFVDDEVVTTKIKKGFLDAVPKALSLSVFCHQGHVVLAGAVPDSRIGEQAVAVARAVEGIVAVKSFLHLKTQ